jgi:hypothetical protein
MGQPWRKKSREKARFRAFFKAAGTSGLNLLLNHKS